MRYVLAMLVCVAVGLDASSMASGFPGCMLCGYRRATPIRLDMESATHVFLTSISNVSADGKVTLAIESSLKVGESRKGLKEITIAHRFNHDPKAPTKYLVFCDEHRGELDPYRGTPIKSPALIEYLRGLIKIDKSEPLKLLEFAGQHLESAEQEVVEQAYIEFYQVTDRQLESAGKKLKPDVLRNRLKDAKTPDDQRWLYARLLGACGNRDDVDLLKSQFAYAGDVKYAGVTAIHQGLMQLDADEDRKLLQTTLGDPRNSFSVRYGALQAVRSLYERWRAADRTELTEMVAPMLLQSDIADLAIEELRRWQCWAMADRVFDVAESTDAHRTQIQRAKLRYAIQCPAAKSPKAAEYLANRRKLDPELVDAAQELLEAEKPSPVQESDR